MRLYLSIIILVLLTAAAMSANAQGTFRNLNFESANVAGDSRVTQIPIVNAFPGWSATETEASFGTQSLTQVYYDALALGSPLIAVNDNELGSGSLPPPLQGSFSAYISGGNGFAFSLMQTGVVPFESKSLLVDIQDDAFGLQTTINGNLINMVPLYDNSIYTVYGGDISAFAGELDQLAFTEPGFPSGIGAATIDDIQFSPNLVPEPGVWSLILCGTAFFGFTRKKGGRD
ncbi:MAG TPA: hypothetical protein VH413_13685 [Verrucomicrobiae bacterium]|jgi:hypothetical protein|nr:hypothetical protein [Verrucomicrobiae bacterium]